MSRGIIAGCVMVSAPGIYFKLWIGILLGCVGGFIVVGSSQLLQKFKIDDPLQVA
jgi:ammonia channel protein AmtB